MSASLIKQKKEMRRTSLMFLCVTLFCGLFSAVYEHFSHGVYSNFMIFLFMFPLFGGALPYAVLWFVPKTKRPSQTASRIFNSGVATLTIGSCVKGGLDIYGTTSSYLPIYWVLGIALIAIALAMYLLTFGTHRERKADV